MNLDQYLTEKPSIKLYEKEFTQIKDNLASIKHEFDSFIENHNNQLQIIDPVVKYKDINLRKNIDTSWKGVKLKAQSLVTSNNTFLNNFTKTLHVTNFPNTSTILLNIVRGSYTTTYHKDVPLALAIFLRLTPKNKSVIRFDFPQYNCKDELVDFGDFTFFNSQTLHCNMNMGTDEVRGIFVGFIK